MRFIWNRPFKAQEDMLARIAFITNIYGGYETSCKPFEKQTIPVDFICFTDNSNIHHNGWIIDTHPYHVTNPSPVDTGNYINSLSNNKHTFNIGKYYKQSFKNIPRLQKYDVIVWLDGSIRITDSNCAKWVMNKIRTEKIISVTHEFRHGNLHEEVVASRVGKYTHEIWFNQKQPVQDVDKHYQACIADGYDENFFKQYKDKNPHFGVWVTCFVAWDNRHASVSDFLDRWYLQTLKHTTQDQVSFSIVVQKTNIIPYTIPDPYYDTYTHIKTTFYDKYQHGN
jgi:hypothetical protein